MTTYAPNFTPRLKVTYRSAGITHSVQIRGARGDDAGAMGGRGVALRDCFNAIPAGNKFTDLAVIGAELALTDSDVFTPVAFTGVTAGTLLVADFSAVARIRALGFNGKSPGSRARFYIYGFAIADEPSGAEGGNGIITSTELAAIGTIAGLASANFRAGSGNGAVFPLQATYKGNDHLLKLVRKGTIA
jgi:hypothetical protein